MAVGVRLVAEGRRRRRRGGATYAYLFVLPYVLFLLAFGIGPSLYGIAISFFDTTATKWHPSGLANYGTAAADFRIGAAFVNALTFMAIWLPLMIVGVLLLSLLLHARVGRFSSTMRLIYYVPGAVAGSASVLLWIFLATPEYSPFGPVLRLLGMSTRNDVLTSDHFPALFALMSFFAGAGGWVVIVYSALMGISRDIFESAAIDGCNALQSARYIKVPLVAKYIVFMLILSFAGGFQIFVEPQLISTVATGSVDLGNWSPNQLLYTYAFSLGNFGVSAAISIGLLLIGLAGALVIILKTDFYRIDV